MYRGLTLSLVLPCRDEAAALPSLLAEVPREVGDPRGWVDEEIVVDNGSTDGTADAARRAGARVVDEPRPGYGRACRAGLEAAQGQLIALCDGDGSYPPDETLRLAAALLDRSLDLVVGARFPGVEVRAMPWLRRVGNRLLTAAARVLFHAPIADSQSGMWCLRRSAWQEMRPRSHGMPFSQEIKLRALAGGLGFAEVRIAYRPRVGFSKLLTWRGGVGNLLALFRLRFELEQERRTRRQS